MSKIIRHEFLGNWFLFFFFCISIVGIPADILYYKENMIVIHEEMEHPSAFLQAYREGKYQS